MLEGLILLVAMFIFFALFGTLVSFVAKNWEDLLLAGIWGTLSMLLVNFIAYVLKAVCLHFFNMSEHGGELIGGFGFIVSLLVGAAHAGYIGFAIYLERKSIEKNSRI